MADMKFTVTLDDMEFQDSIEDALRNGVTTAVSSEVRNFMWDNSVSTKASVLTVLELEIKNILEPKNLRPIVRKAAHQVISQKVASFLSRKSLTSLGLSEEKILTMIAK